MMHTPHQVLRAGRQEQHNKRRAVRGLIKGAPDARDSAHIPSSFHPLAFFWLDCFPVHTPAQVTQAVSPVSDSYHSKKSHACPCSYYGDSVKPRSGGLSTVSKDREGTSC